jgi:hypothetical protein
MSKDGPRPKPREPHEDVAGYRVIHDPDKVLPREMHREIVQRLKRRGRGYTKSVKAKRRK